MGDHFAAFAILHASISKTLKTLRDFSREKKHKTIYDRAAFQELISPFEKCGVELQQRLDTVSDIYAFLEHFEITSGRAEMGLTTPPDVFLKHLPNILPKVEPALMQINSSELSDEVKRKRKNVAFLRALIEESKFGDNVRLAEAIMKDILSNPYFSSEPGLVMAFINYSPAFNRLLAKYIFTTRHYPMEIMREWIKSVVEKGDADRDISKFVLSKPPFTEGPDPIKDMIIKRCMGTTGRSIGPQLELTPGTVIKTSGYKLKVLSCAGKGNTGAVYKAQTMNGKGEQIVGLKVCVKYEPEVILSMQRESKKMAFLEELQVCKYTAILEAGDDYAVKEWAEGITGVEWFKVWEMDGAKTSDESFRKLIQLFRKVGEKKIYLQNFKPHNLLWDQEQRLWQVIDYGGHKALNTPEEVVEKYYEKFDDMWNKNKKLVPSCAELVRRMQREEALEKKKLEDSRRTASSTSTPTPTPSPLSGASISTSASSSSIPAQPFNGAASVNGKAKGKEKEQQEKEKEKKEQQEQRGEKEKKEEEEEQSAAAAAAPGKKGKKSTKKEKKEEKKKEKKEKKNSSKKESIERSRSVGESEEGEEAEGGGEGGGGGGEGGGEEEGQFANDQNFQIQEDEEEMRRTKAKAKARRRKKRRERADDEDGLKKKGSSKKKKRKKTMKNADDEVDGTEDARQKKEEEKKATTTKSEDDAKEKRKGKKRKRAEGQEETDGEAADADEAGKKTKKTKKPKRRKTSDEGTTPPPSEQPKEEEAKKKKTKTKNKKKEKL